MKKIECPKFYHFKRFEGEPKNVYRRRLINNIRIRVIVPIARIILTPLALLYALYYYAWEAVYKTFDD